MGTELLEADLELLRCPRCSGKLSLRLECAGCSAKFESSGGIPLLFSPSDASDPRDVTDIVKSFYEETPFPNYDDIDSVGSLIQKARKGYYARMLDEQVPFKARVLECGCGTGQLTNFLSIANREVVGADMCLNSLRLAQAFKERNGLTRARFVQMNLFRPVFKPESFDLVLCHGVLHHTGDPVGGFRSIAKLVKKGGYISIGLYNTYGRLITDARRGLFRVFGERLTFLDPMLRRLRGREAKKTAWFRDQYQHPHESKHTFGEVLGWFEEAGFDFVNSVPSSVPFRRFSGSESLFKPSRPGAPWERGLAQLGMVIPGYLEGGFFIMIGRKR